MGILWWKKDKSLIIPGYRSLVDNEIYMQERSDDLRDVLVVTNYSLPMRAQIIDYLQRKSADVNKLLSEKYYPSSNVLQSTNLELLLQSDMEMTEKLEKMDNQTQENLKQYFPKDVQSDIPNIVDLSKLKTHKNFLSLRNGTMSLQKIDRIVIMEGNKDALYWDKALTEEKWTLDIFYDYQWPRHSKIREAIKWHTVESKIIKTTNVENYQEEMEEVVKALYQYIDKKNSQFWQWKEKTKEKIEELSYLTLNNLYCDRFIKKRQKDHKQLFLPTFNVYGNSTLN